MPKAGARLRLVRLAALQLIVGTSTALCAAGLSSGHAYGRSSEALG
jgi:hypothetical protein